MNTFDDFVRKWTGSERPEEAASKEQFLNLCAVLDFPEPVDVDKRADHYGLEKRVIIAFGKYGFADAWIEGQFVWEYKSEGENLEEAYVQALKYRAGAGNPPLTIVSNMHLFKVYTEYDGTKQHIYEFDLEALQRNEPNLLGGRTPQDVLYAAFHEPEYLRPDNPSPKFTDQAAYLAWREKQYVKNAVFSDIPSQARHSIVGRRELLKRVKDGLFKGQSVALHGMAGIGKTAIPIAIAHDQEARTHFFGGILWARLEKDANVLAELEGWARAVGISKEEIDKLTSQDNYDQNVAALSQAINHAIGQRRMLLVIDDAWKLEDALPFRIGSRCSQLLTTRFHKIADDFAEDVEPVTELTAEDGFILLEELAPNAVAAERTQVARLVEAVYGLPLALVIMGSYLRSQSTRKRTRIISAAIGKLKDAKVRLEEVLQLSPTEQHPSLPNKKEISLKASIEVSYKALPDDELRRIFRSFSVLPPKPRSFSEDAVLTITKANIKILDSLVEYTLIDDDGKNYAMHPVVRDYAYELLAEGEKKSYHEEAAHYFQQEYHLTHPDAHTHPARNLADAQPLLDAYDQLLAAGDYEAAAKLLMDEPLELIGKGKETSMTHLLLRWGEAGRLARMINNLVNSPTGVLQERTRGIAIGNLGSAYRNLGNNDMALTFYKQSLRIVEDIHDLEATESALGNLGNLYTVTANYNEAISYYQRAVNLAEQLNDLEGKGTHLGNLGNAYYFLGQYVKAMEFFGQALQITKLYGDRQGEGRAYSNLGNCHAALGHLQQAINYYQQALNVAQDIGDNQSMPNHLNGLGDTYTKLGDYKQAIGHLQQALQVVELTGDSRAKAAVLGNFGNVYASLDDPQLATNYWLQALYLAEKVGDSNMQGNQWNNLGLGFEALKKDLISLACYLHALHIREQIGNRQRIQNTLDNIARIRATVGEAAWHALVAKAQSLATDPTWRPALPKDEE